MDNKQDFEKTFQNSQYNFFKEEWDKKWKEIFPEKEDLKSKILALEYENFHLVNNAFGKLGKALQICNFLYELSKSKPPQDTEKIRITILVSCAEAIYRINKPSEELSENLVKGFFKSITSKINHKIRGHLGETMPYKKTFGAEETLFLIRNDYIHNGNFTGVFFRNNNSESDVYNLGDFYYSEKDDKAKLIQAISECNLTYEEFLEIFLEAFIENINKYCQNLCQNTKA